MTVKQKNKISKSISLFDFVFVVCMLLFVVYILLSQFGFISTIQDPYSGFTYIAIVAGIVFILFMIWRYKQLSAEKESG